MGRREGKGYMAYCNWHTNYNCMRLKDSPVCWQQTAADSSEGSLQH